MDLSRPDPPGGSSKLLMTTQPTTMTRTVVRQDARGSERRANLTVLALLAPVVLLSILFLYYPLVFIIEMSFTQGNSFLAKTGPVYTAENYVDMFGRYLPNVLVTLKLAGLSMIANLIFGFPFAYILVRKVKYRDLVRSFMVFPMFGALYIAFGMRFILLPGGMATPLLQAFSVENTEALYSLPSVVFAMSVFTFPFMVMNIGTALSNVDPVLEEAAACLGARPWQTFLRVLLPLTRSGLVAGSLMVFGWNIGTFAEPILLGSIDEQKTLAWTLFQRGVVQTDYGLSTTMSVILLILAFAVTYLSLRYSRGALVE
jgi:ABC-type spermidine/putrescine transport system permease subunit I